MNNNEFSPSRRRTLKAVAGVTVTGMATASSVMAGVPLPAKAVEPAGQTIDCKLICRDDDSRAYLLMHNETDVDIVTNEFHRQTIRYGNMTLNMEKAFAQPVTIKSHDRILVRLNLESGRAGRNEKDIIEFRVNTKYPTVGTRAVDVPVRVYQGVGIIDALSVHPA